MGQKEMRNCGNAELRKCGMPQFRNSAILAILVVALTCVSVVAQVASPSPTAPASKSGKITGRVVNEKGQPLPNARVLVIVAGSTTQNQNATTDTDGKFEFSGLDRSNYRISAWLPTYAPLLRNPPDTQSSNSRVGDSVTIVLTKGGVITGTVLNQTGEPIVGIRVRARMVGDAVLAWPYSQVPLERTTDDRGIYRIYGLAAGTYVVWAGGSQFNSGADPFDADVPTYSPSSTRDTAAEITVRVGEETNNVDIRYRGEPGHRVSGTVSGPEIAKETRYGIELTSVRDGGALWSSMRYVESQSDRGFIFHGVDDGDYYVTARSALGNSEFAVSTPKRIKIEGADVTGIELIVEPLGSVSGRVVLEESNATECKDKERPFFSETLVSAWHKESEATKELPRSIWSIGAPVNPDAEGNVTIRSLAPGEYRFATEFSAKYWYLHSISLTSRKTQPAKSINAARTWTTIKSGDRLSGLTVTLAQGAGSLRGQIALGEGETLPERLVVYLVPVEREKSEEVLRYFAAQVTANAKIALNNVAPGRYWILAQPAVDSASSPLTQIRLPDSTELRAMLRRAAEASKTEVEFKPCQDVVDFRLKL